MIPPRILSIQAQGNKKLLVKFPNGAAIIYDCTPLLQLERFSLLKNEAFFRAVKVDPGGYGVSWNDDMDLSEYELWTNGEEVGEPEISAS